MLHTVHTHTYLHESNFNKGLKKSGAQQLPACAWFKSIVQLISLSLNKEQGESNWSHTGSAYWLLKCVIKVITT